MRVLLVNPVPTGLMRLGPPLGLGYVGVAAAQVGHDVMVYDQAIRNEYPFIDVLAGFRPDVAGITCYSSQFPTALSTAKFIKKFSPNTKIVAGGIHASSYPEYILSNHPEFDYVVRGEGEVSFVKLLEFFSNPDGVPGVYYRRKGTVIGVYPNLLADLDEIISPWYILDPRNYRTSRPAGVVSRYSNIGVILGSRGCPFDCSFCCASVVHGKKIRLRSVSNILAEIDYLMSYKGVKEIQITDDNFTFHREHVVSFCDEIIKRKMKFSWTLPNGIRADRVDEEVLRKMKAAGCYYFAIGIESGSDDVLKMISKNLSLERVRETVETADRLGFITQGFFILGIPGETDFDRTQSMNFAASLPLDRMCVAPAMALPGSRLFSELMNDDLTKINLSNSCYKQWAPMPGAPDAETVLSAIRKMRMKFYLNPRRTLRHISKVRTPRQALGFITGVKELF